MKQLILVTILFLSVFQIKAQSNTEVVYLKNGSIVRGTIIEQTPYKSYTIQTRDGSIFVYPIEEIIKITKDQTSSIHQIGSNYFQFTPGYKGFIDAGYTFGTGDYGLDRIEFSTSHGYQFNPYFYLGIGAGFSYFVSPELISAPIFANPRLTLPIDKAVAPFLDIKIGYTVGGDIKGFYFSPSIGTRFDIGYDKALNFSVGYTVQSVNYNFYDYFNNYYYFSERKNCGGVTLKLGLEF